MCKEGLGIFEGNIPVFAWRIHNACSKQRGNMKCNRIWKDWNISNRIGTVLNWFRKAVI
jgi:hypothetical protein